MNSLPYYPISRFYQERFGEKVYKISLTTEGSCPNRNNPHQEICVFCDEWGGAAYHQNAGLSVKEQIQHHREKIGKRYGCRLFLAYFQTYTSTFSKIAPLEKNIETALACEGICGVVIATRPDCLPQKTLEMIQRLSKQYYFSVELGVQSFQDEQLNFLKRGHSVKKSLDAIYALGSTGSVDVGLHLIFGLPGENKESLIQTAKLINTLPVQNVKLHNLHVLKNTTLEKIYNSNGFKPVSLQEYSERVGAFLQHLSPSIAVQRLVAVASRWDDLVAPDWTRHKMAPTQTIINNMVDKSIYQGQRAVCELR